MFKDQSAEQALKTTRGFIYFIGVATILWNGFMFANAGNEAQEATEAGVAALEEQGQKIDESKIPNIVADVKANIIKIYGVFIVTGFVFLFLGYSIYKKPIPITIASLLLYVSGKAYSAYLDPSSLSSGSTMMIMCLMALGYGIKAAFQYERESDYTPPRPDANDSMVA